MKQTAGAPKRESKKKEPTSPQTPSQPVSVSESHWLDKLADSWQQFSRFGWDVLGVCIIAAALITLLGLLGLSQGSFMLPWVSLLRHWLGWGSYLVMVSVGALGVFALWRHFTNLPGLHVGKILAFEGLIISALSVLAITGGRSLERAELGLDGGLIGWGLAELTNTLFPGALNNLFWLILFILCTLSAFGIFSWLANRIEAWLEAGVEEEALPTAGGIPVQIPIPFDEQQFDEDDDFESDDDAAGVAAGVAVEPAPVRPPKAKPAKFDKAASPNDGKTPEREGLPPFNLLLSDTNVQPDENVIHETATLLEVTLAEFGIPARVVGFRVGPTVTQYAVEPGFIEKTGLDGEPVRQKVRVSQISTLSRDLALRLSAERLRIEAPVPGQSFVGIEVPNRNSAVVRLRPLMESPAFRKLNVPLALALGQDVSGQPVVADLSRMPHMLIAGTTGSGKSICIQALTLCLAMNNRPEDLKMAMLDPKMVELIRFNGLPHLLGKVETQPERMTGVLQWALSEMDARYRLLESARSRNLETYNRRLERRGQAPLPRIVIVVDELADLMMAAPEQTERSIVRLAQLARATGIHLIVATQRPSTDVVTGLIKANFPARLAFTVASSVDSRVILDATGAETLLGRGDMLFLNPESGTPQRAQGALVTDQEIERVIEFWKKMAPQPEVESPWESLVQSEEAGPDSLVDQAVKIVRSSQRASASMLQRRLRIGYPRAARLIDELEEMGVIGPSQTGGREREVLIPREDEDENGDGSDIGGAPEDE
jgi:S-DNA-T family DNA segregation ATPase FtsK/SpoIIIE